MFNSFRMSKSDIIKYIRIINSYKPELIRGYAGSLFEIAKYANSHSIPVHSPEIII